MSKPKAVAVMPAEPPAKPDRGDPVEVARRRRRLAEVFGEVLPEATGDDQPERGADERADERWYLENRPPHHEPDS